MTKKIKCFCEHTFQDKQYGQGIRVMNQMVSLKQSKYRCTVCARVVEV